MNESVSFPGSFQRGTIRLLRFRAATLLFFFIFSVTPAAAAETLLASNALIDMSLDSLMNIQVVTTNKRPEKNFRVPAAITVLTGDELRRMGVNSIAEALRLAPGMEVSRFSAFHWAVSARGFNGQFADKLLVLVDGRSVYTPLTSGVPWSRVDTTIDDIDRIEIIRGPGGSIWGANAINGIVNIITKTAKETQGFLAYGGGGQDEEGFGGVRYGGKVGEQAFLRGFLRYRSIDGMQDEDGVSLDDGWDTIRGGFRLDTQPSSSRKMSLTGEVYTNKLFLESESRSGRVKESSDSNGGNIVGRWEQTFDDDSDLVIEIYVSRTERFEDTASDPREVIDTFDFDLTRRQSFNDAHEVSWGLGYRYVHFDNVIGGSSYYLNEKRSDNLFTAFLQDHITITENRLWLTVGSKFEHNDYTGAEYQPSIRLMYTPDQQNALWAAVTRAVKTPDRADSDLGIKTSFFELRPSPDIVSENVTAYETGYRRKYGDWLLMDLAVHYNVYNDLTTQERMEESGIGVYYQSNEMSGNSYGLELSLTSDVTDYWRLRAGYTRFQIDLEVSSTSVDDDSDLFYEENTPASKLFIASYLSLPGHIEADLFVSYVDELRFRDIDAYTKVDARLGWRPHDAWEVSVIGRNLSGGGQVEYEQSYRLREQTEQSIWFKVTYNK